MTASETKKYEMLLRVREFGEANKALFAGPGQAEQAFEEVNAAVDRLTAQAVSKMESRSTASSKAKARRTLTGQLEAISRCARVIAETTPGFNDPFRMPRPQTDQALLTTGRVFVREAENVAARFVDLALPPTFVQDLCRAVDALDQAIHGFQVGRDGHTAARASIRQALAQAGAALRKLDVLVANRLRDNPVLLEVWKRDRRVESAGRSKKVVPVPPQDTPASEPPLAA